MNDPILPAKHKSYIGTSGDEYMVEAEVLKTIIGHNQIEIGIGIHGFTEEQKKWLSTVIPQQLQRAYEQGFVEARHQVRQKLRDALGIKP